MKIFSKAVPQTLMTKAALVMGLIVAQGAGLVLASPTNAGPPGFAHEPAMFNAMAVQNRHGNRLLDQPGVEGIATAIGRGGQPVIKLFINHASVRGLPVELEGVPVEVFVSGRFFARPAKKKNPPPPPEYYPRPVPIGVSVGHPDVSAGTIGARVKDAAGNRYLLSNNHVLANSDAGYIGDLLLQPGAGDGGRYPEDSIGALYDFVPIDFWGGDNRMDAALGLVTEGDVGFSTPPDGYGTPGVQVSDAYLSQPVQKYGRTTGLTTGWVSEVNVTVDVCYEMMGFLGCIQEARYVDQVAISPGEFSDGGDSGSLIVTNDASRSPVALLFAGSKLRTLANPIRPVLETFGVSIDDGSSLPPDPDGCDSITLGAVGYKVKGRQQVELTWDCAEGSSVDIVRNSAGGTALFTTENDGSYLDMPEGHGKASYSYRLCQTDGSVCSDETIVNF